MHRLLSKLRLAVAFIPLLAICQAAWAQPGRGEGIRFGWEETIVPRAGLSADQEQALEAMTELPGWSVGFAYRRAFLFGGGFSFWHWHGRFVLFSGDNVWELIPGQLQQILGPEAAERVRVPLVYRFPPGIVTMIVGSIALYVWVRLFPSKFARVQRLLRDARYVQAADVYDSSLPPPEEEVTVAHRRQALALATDYLVERSVPRERAAADLKEIISSRDEDRSKVLRTQALNHELAGEWDEALDLYEEAAELRELWDPKDYNYLRKCIARVEQKQASA
jgi:hypothetical protein